MRIHQYTMKIEIIQHYQNSAWLNLDFVLVTTLDSLKKEKGRQYLDQWLYWEPYFSQINVPVWILSEDSPAELYQLQEALITKLHFSHASKETLETLRSIQSKSVFGKDYLIVKPQILLFYQKKVVYKASRTNQKTIGEAYLKALDIRYKIFKTNFRNKLTSKKEFASI